MFISFGIYFFVLILNNNVNTQITCNFDDSLCGYSSNLKFIRFKGPSPSKSSGPEFDNTSGDGYYALCYGSMLINLIDTCELKQFISLENDKYFQFYYFMYGRQIGTLMVLLDKKIIWSLSGSQSDEWLFSKIIIPKGTYELEFVGNRSIDGRVSSDIAIDDILIEDGPVIDETTLNQLFSTKSSEYSSINNVTPNITVYSTNISKITTTINFNNTFQTSTKNISTQTNYTSQIVFQTTTTTTITENKVNITTKLSMNTINNSTLKNDYLLYVYILGPLLFIVIIILSILIALIFLMRNKSRFTIAKYEKTEEKKMYNQKVDGNDELNLNSKNIKLKSNLSEKLKSNSRL